MTTEPPSSSEQPKPLPKATMPVELAPPAQKPSGELAAAEPSVEEIPEQLTEYPAQATAPAVSPEPAVAKPVGLKGWLRSLSLVEKFCCAAIVVAVVVFAALVFVPALFDFPEETELATADDFPLKGTQLEVLSAETYWREPVLEGEGAEAVRPGTVLIPVLDAKLQGKGQVQVIFRNGQAELAGDPVSITLDGVMDASAASTAGFTERGDFTAYQAGQIELWFIEFHELPEGAEGISDKTLLFKMNISPTLK